MAIASPHESFEVLNSKSKSKEKSLEGSKKSSGYVGTEVLPYRRHCLDTRERWHYSICASQAGCKRNNNPEPHDAKPQASKSVVIIASTAALCSLTANTTPVLDVVRVISAVAKTS